MSLNNSELPEKKSSTSKDNYVIIGSNPLPKIPATSNELTIEIKNEATNETSEFDPGTYEILFPTFVRRGQKLESEKIEELRKGRVVNISAIVIVQDRVRGQLSNKSGWLTLKKIQTGKTFVKSFTPEEKDTESSRMPSETNSKSPKSQATILVDTKTENEKKMPPIGDLEIRSGWFDRHGFLHDETEENKINKEKIDRKAEQHELERTMKWARMLFGGSGSFRVDPNKDIKQRAKYWRTVVLKHGKLKKRIRKGIPAVFRPEVWIHITGARAKRIKKPTLYQKLVREHELGKYDGQIWKDIKRSFRKHSSYSDNKGELSRSSHSIFRVLAAYTDYNPEMGYNQAESFVIALLLMYMEEEDAFWLLDQLVNDPKYAMSGMWSAQMPLALVRFGQFKFLADKYCPKIHKVFRELNVEPMAYKAAQWFLTIFLANDKIPFDIMLRIWDIYLNEGTKFVFRVGLAILKRFGRRLKGNFDELHVWKNLETVTADIDVAIIEEALSFNVTHKELAKFEDKIRRAPRE